MKKNDYHNAIESYKKALSLDANIKKAYFNLAGAYHLLKDSKNAIKYWGKSIQYDPDNYEAYLNLATVYLNETKDTLKALRYIRSAWELKKNDPNIILKYGLILLKANNPYRAIEKFEDALELDNNLFEAKISLAQCYIKLKKPKKALESLEKCSEKEKEQKDYLIFRLMALVEISKNSKDKNLNDTIMQICDKILTQFGSISLVEEIKKLYEKEV